MAEHSSADDIFPALHLENQLCFSLYRLSRLVTQSYGPLLKPLDITYPQYLVLLVLWQNEEPDHSRGSAQSKGAQSENKPSMSVSDLTKALQLDTGTVTPLLKRMESKFILERQRRTDDERVVMVSLTDYGRELREKAKSIPQQLMCQVDMAPQDVLSLRSQLQGLVEQLNS